MGMFDDVSCELPLPDGREVQQDGFQTKSLWRSLDKFTITKTGSLIYHPRRYVSESATGDALVPGKMVHEADIDLDFHGDISIHGTAKDGAFVSYVVRFTHGVVEWIRPFDDLS